MLLDWLVIYSSPCLFNHEIWSNNGMKSLKHFYYFTIQLVFPEQIQNKISSVKLITFVVKGIEVANFLLCLWQRQIRSHYFQFTYKDQPQS